MSIQPTAENYLEEGLLNFNFKQKSYPRNCLVYPIRIPISCPTKLHLLYQPPQTQLCLPISCLVISCVNSNTHSLLNFPLVGSQGKQLPSKVAYIKCLLAAVMLHSTHIWKPNSSSQLWFKHKNHVSLYVTPDPGPTQIAANTPTNSIICHNWHWRAMVWWMTSAQTYRVRYLRDQGNWVAFLSDGSWIRFKVFQEILSTSFPGYTNRTSQLVIPRNLQYLHTIHFNYQKDVSYQFLRIVDPLLWSVVAAVRRTRVRWPAICVHDTFRNISLGTEYRQHRYLSSHVRFQSGHVTSLSGHVTTDI